MNAGSDTVTVFVAHWSRLFRQQVIFSGGRFPVSVAVHGNLVYVLNALSGGSVRGYRVFAGRLFPIRGSKRLLHLDATASPLFVNTPARSSSLPMAPSSSSGPRPTETTSMFSVSGLVAPSLPAPW